MASLSLKAIFQTQIFEDTFSGTPPELILYVRNEMCRRTAHVCHSPIFIHLFHHFILQKYWFGQDCICQVIDSFVIFSKNSEVDRDCELWHLPYLPQNVWLNGLNQNTLTFKSSMRKHVLHLWYFKIFFGKSFHLLNYMKE